MTFPNVRSLLLLTSLLSVISCSKDRSPDVCDCANTYNLSTDTLLVAGKNLPQDLTCVVALTKTPDLVIGKTVELYNDLYEEHTTLNKGDEEWEALSDEIEKWLGGHHIGECGNLAEGYTIKRYRGMGKRIDIRIDVARVKPLARNDSQENGPYGYNSEIIFVIGITDQDGNQRKGEQPARFVVSSCTRYAHLDPDWSQKISSLKNQLESTQ